MKKLAMPTTSKRWLMNRNPPAAQVTFLMMDGEPYQKIAGKR
jgi:hypothetical protein